MFKNTLILLGLLLFAFCLNAQQSQTVYTYGQMTNTSGASIEITFVVEAGGVSTTGMATTEPDGGFITQISWVGSTWSSITASFMNCDSTLTSVTVNNNPDEVDNPVDVPFELNYCETLNVPGCTDPAAENYDPEANIDDGSCIYVECEGTEYLLNVSSETFGNSLDYELIYENENFSGTTPDNATTFSIPFCLEDGCGTLVLEPGEENAGGTYFNFFTGFESFESGQIYPGEEVIINFGNQEDCESQNFHFGCTDEEALNFNPWATDDNGNCEYVNEEVENDLCANASPLLEGTHLINNDGADSNEGILGECWAFGYGEGEQSSIWYTFTTPEDPVAITIEAIADGSNTLTDTQFAIFDGCIGEMIYCDGNSGEGLMSKFEFACGELESNTTYNLVIDGYQGDSGTCYLEYSVDSPCEEAEACEANPAVVNIVTNTWSEEISWAILQEGELIAEGSSYGENNYQYTEEICLEDGCYTFEMYDSYGDGWNGGEFSIWLEDGTFITSGALETGEYGSVTFGVNAECEEEIAGCTDPEALNYNPEATVDDGSCEYSDCDENEILVQLNAGPGALFEWSFENAEEYLEGGGYNAQGAIEEYTFCVEDGCYNFTIYDFSDSEWTGLVSIYVNGQTYLIEPVSNDSNLSFDIAVNGNCEEEVEGCTDPEALNYNPEATVDDGSCEYSDCGANEILVQLNAGPEALFEWSFENAEEYLEGGGYNAQGAIEEYTFCVEDGCYNFTIYDFSESEWTGLVCIYINGEVYLIEPISNDSNLSFDIPVNSNCGEEIEGCTDPEALNYNPVATVDDGSCEYEDCTPVQFTHDYTGTSVDYYFPFEITNQDGDIVVADSLSGTGGSDNDFCLQDGCYTLSVNGIPSEWTGIISINIGEEYWQPNFNFEILPDENGSFSENFSINDTSCLDEVIEGCTAWFAENYNPDANVYDGSCIFDADCEDNQTVLFIQNGQWNIQDEAGNTVSQGGTTQFSGLINPICLSDGCYTIQVNSIGNYPASFELYEGAELLASGENSNNYNLEFGINCGEEIEGCTDPEALNYNEEATIDDGSCEYEEVPCEANNIQVIIETEAWGGEISWAIYGDQQQTIAEGAGYQSDSTYIHDLCLEDGCYQFGMYDSYGDGWNGGTFTILLEGEVIDSGTLEDGNADWEGSFDSINFSINSDDCFFQGCTDPEAENYNPDATIDDGSCIYPAECSISFDLTADSLNLNTLFVIPSDSIGEAVGVLWDFGDGTTSTDLFPNHEYEGDGPYNLCLTVFFEVGQNDTCDVTFCMEITADMIPDLIPGAGGNSSGFFINVIDDASTIGVDEEQYFEKIEVYPNPTTNFVTVSSEMNWADGTTITLHNMHGAILNSQPVQFGNGNSNYKIDLSEYSSGLYFINVSSQGEQKTFKILKD